jgi:hypothetical protein
MATVHCAKLLPNRDSSSRYSPGRLERTGSSNDESVTHRLNAAPRDALVVPVHNNFLGRDPAPVKFKYLRVEYSYGGDPRIFTVSRPEHSRFVLPEDSTALTTPKTPPPAKLRDRIFDLCLQLNTFLGKHGKRPDPYLIPINDKDEYVRLYEEKVQAWDDKFQADYWLN